MKISYSLTGLVVLCLSLLPKNALSAQGSIRDGLVAEWNFDEISGTQAADSTGENHGELFNFAGDDSQWVDGKIGGAIAFDGSNYVEVPDDSTIGAGLVKGFTVMAWFKSNVPLDANGGGNRMLEKGNNYFFLQGVGTGGMNFLVKNEGSNFTATIGDSLEANVWYHIAGVFDGGIAKTYLNGELKGMIELPGPMDDDMLPLRIGSDDSGNFFNGTMDQVLIWARPLSFSEIRTVMNGSFDLPESELLQITEQPISQELFEGSTATLQITAEGSGTVRYLWFKGEEPLRAQTDPVLILSDVSLEDAGQYTCRVQSELGEVMSDPVVLSILPVEGLGTGRIAYWAFDESSGNTAFDASGNDHHGELLDFSTNNWTEGQIEGALHFNGFSAVSIDESDVLNSIGDEASFSFWIRLNTYGELESAGSFDRTTSYVLRKGNHFGIRIIHDPGTITRTLAVRAGAGEDSGAVPRKLWEANAPQGSAVLDLWQHFTIVYKGGEVQFYKNGFPIGNPIPASLGESDSEPMIIGNFDDFESTRFLDGELDELMIWARPLREAEILEIAGKDVESSPVVEVQPLSQKKLEGTTALFHIVATGKRPVSYQWLKNGTPIAEATSNRLMLSRLLPQDAGIYSVKVSNEQGETISEGARLQIEPLGAITSGLVAHYTFDAIDASKIGDASGNHLSGILTNFDENPIADGVIGGALAFDGEDDFVEIAHSDLLSLGTEATISLWLSPVLFSGGSDFDRVFRKDVNYDFVLINGNIARVHGINKTPYSSPADAVNPEQWQHFAYVVKNDSIQWYRNGEALGEPLSGKLGEGNSHPLILGNYEAEPSEGNWINRPYQGLMDDLGIWQRALTPNDILSIYENGLGGKPLSEELPPVQIRSIHVEGDVIRLRFFTPFSSRDHIVQMKNFLDNEVWIDLAEVSLTEIGEGIFSFDIPLNAESSFFRIVSIPPPPIFFDDFENGAIGWTHGGENDEWEWGSPSIGPSSAFSGTNVFGTDLDGDFEPFTESYLRSPPIDLSNVNVANLRFAEFHSVDAEIDFHSVIVNVLDENDNFIEEVFRAAGSTTGWTRRTIRLAGSSVGTKVKIEFVLLTDELNPLPGFYIDDVEVREN